MHETSTAQNCGWLLRAKALRWAFLSFLQHLDISSSRCQRGKIQRHPEWREIAGNSDHRRMLSRIEI